MSPPILPLMSCAECKLAPDQTLAQEDALGFFSLLLSTLLELCMSHCSPSCKLLDINIWRLNLWSPPVSYQWPPFLFETWLNWQDCSSKRARGNIFYGSTALAAVQLLLVDVPSCCTQDTQGWDRAELTLQVQQCLEVSFGAMLKNWTVIGAERAFSSSSSMVPSLYLSPKILNS